jgi:hypothetical protein
MELLVIGTYRTTGMKMMRDMTLLLLSMLLVGMSIDLWKKTCISSLCSCDKLLFSRF